ncbi:sulfotransferase [Rhodobacter sp. NTK016B]|uniref:sulfotransferase n=1 Tax=Rhodobacter sp. NTK016B TaxID=2759676 RepID=UPI001A8EE0D6|nr:sulfotransferase [Rhodobacter sp. NTK016B]MBN8290534.1 sulfotransferase [Rhodobacter sp. NTK016B]
MATEMATSCPRPVAIGGLGGSGTRVFASLLQTAGLHIGDCLNVPLDNLWFTVLFKRAMWAHPANPRIPEPTDVATSIRLFVRAMTEGISDDLDEADRARITRLRADLPPDGHWRCGAKAVHADSLMQSPKVQDGPTRRWGWKEPNTHIFLPHLDRAALGLRYIHIVRDGYDMAFSGNTWQMRHWGHLYGCPADANSPWPQQQLRYWVAANHAALTYGRSLWPFAYGGPVPRGALR